MLKIILLFTLFFLEIILFSLTPSQAYADECAPKFIYNPPEPDLKQSMGKTLDITISSASLPGGDNEYFIQLKTPNSQFPIERDLKLDTEGETTARFELSGKEPYLWEAGKYTVNFGSDNDLLNPKCTRTFTISEVATQPSCAVTITSTKHTPDTNVSIKVEGISKAEYQIFIYGQDGSKMKEFKNQMNDADNNFSLGNFPVGQYQVLIKNVPISEMLQLQCPAAPFTVFPRGSTGDGSDPIPSTPCTGDGCSSARGDPCGTDTNPGFKTAIGCIHTSPAEFIKDFLTFIIAISGGLAFLMMLLGAFGMLTSAGNPEALNAGRERLTSAIIGLLFVIFAILLMQIIGVGILNIPGFT